MTVPPPVIQRRRAERAALLARARAFVETIPDGVRLRAAVVVGSVARGDFNSWSDIDVVVIADGLPERVLDRYTLLGRLPARVEVVLWTPAEWDRQRQRRNPIAVEAVECGVWLVGGPSPGRR